jgi:hypothetical protein
VEVYYCCAYETQNFLFIPPPPDFICILFFLLKKKKKKRKGGGGGEGVIGWGRGRGYFERIKKEGGGI